MATATQEATEQILEYCDARDVTIRAEEGLLRGVKILGQSSQNGRTYPKEVMARAAPLYEGIPVNINHPDKVGQSRRYEDRIGRLENVRLGQGDSGLFADFRFNPKHPVAEQLKWDAEHAPRNVGFSHVADGKVSRRGQTTVVEEITRVQSVDLVADPATTRGLFEGHQEPEVTMADNPVNVDNLTADQLPKPLIEAISAAAVKKFTESEDQKAKDAEIKSLREQVDGYKAAEKVRKQAEAVDALLAESKLPKEVVSDLFRQQLIEADDAKRAALIEDRRKLVQEQMGRPRSQEQTTQAVTEGGSLDVSDPDAIRRDAGYRVAK